MIVIYILGAIGAFIATSYFIYRIMNTNIHFDDSVIRLWSVALGLLTLVFTLDALQEVNTVDTVNIAFFTRTLHSLILLQALAVAIHIRCFKLDYYYAQKANVKGVRFVERIRRIGFITIQTLTGLIPTASILFMITPYDIAIISPEYAMQSTGFIEADKYLQIIEILISLAIYLVVPFGRPYSFFKIAFLGETLARLIEGYQIIFGDIKISWPFYADWIANMVSIALIGVGIIENRLYKKKHSS